MSMAMSMAMSTSGAVSERRPTALFYPVTMTVGVAAAALLMAAGVAAAIVVAGLSIGAALAVVVAERRLPFRRSWQRDHGEMAECDHCDWPEMPSFEQVQRERLEYGEG